MTSSQRITEIVRFEHVSKNYRKGLFGSRAVAALRNVSLGITAGSAFGIVGPNRAGKTTLIKILLSLSRPTSGTVTRLGRPSRDRGTLAAVGYIHESQAFPRYLTATSLLQYYGALSCVPPHVLQTRIPELLERVGLHDRSSEPIACFSKGMVQRLALAQALLNDPELLVLDEPAEGMDLLGRQLLHEILDERRRRGKTVILVSHSLADVERLCDRLAVLRCGEIAFEGPLSELHDLSPAASPWNFESALQPLYEGVPA